LPDVILEEKMRKGTRKREEFDRIRKKEEIISDPCSFDDPDPDKI
jgi:hypothetical protein